MRTALWSKKEPSCDTAAQMRVACSRFRMDHEEISDMLSNAFAIVSFCG